MSNQTPYTPTTAQVAENYAMQRGEDDGAFLAWHTPNLAPYRAEFQRWLAEHDAQVRATALEDAATALEATLSAAEQSS